MEQIGQSLAGLFTLILKPFETASPYWGLTFISLLTGAVMLFLFKVTSNQEAMKEVKTKISAYFLELRLYKEDISNVLAAQKRILRANLSYFGLSAIPAVVMIIPVVLIMIQLNLRYAHRSLEPADYTLVKVITQEGFDVLKHPIGIRCGEGVEKASPAVRIPSERQVCWKIRVVDPGIHKITISTPGGDVTVPIFSGSRLRPLYTVFKKASLWESIVNPGCPRVPAQAPIESISISYPSLEFSLLGVSTSWLWFFLIISFVFGFFLKFILKVE